MTVTVRIRWSAALAAMVAVAVLAGCGSSAGRRPAPSIGAPSGPAVILRFGNHVAAGTLFDTPESRQLAAMLPATVDLKDVWGQAKSGRLPSTLTAGGSTPIHDPRPGDIYFWPTSEVLAIYYDDLGQTVPDPGLIHLGALTTGLDDLAATGRRTTVRIDLAPTSR
ncbi:MAG: cyclophilin-like fold protein [Actinoplanes sp.]